MEVRVKNKYYMEHGSTVRKYNYKIGEQKELEYRIEPKDEKDVQVVSLTFLKGKLFEDLQKYDEIDFLNFKFPKEED